MSTVRMAELCLYATCRLVMFYISTKYHQNIPKGIQVTERKRNLFQTKVRKAELSFLHARRSNFLPCIVKIFQRVFKLQSEQVVLR